MRFKIKFITLAIISLFFSKLVSAETAPGFGSWDDVLKAADGGQVNVYMWGGSDAINGFVDDFYGVPLKEKYNITLNRVPLAGTVDALPLSPVTPASFSLNTWLTASTVPFKGTLLRVILYFSFNGTP